MAFSNKSLAYALLRLTMGINFAGHGLIRVLVIGVSTFAHGAANNLSKSPIPHSLNLGFLYLVPIVEAIVGILLILGLFTREALIASALLISMLTLGVTSNQQWDVAGLQLTYALVLSALLFLLEYNTFSLDGLRKR